MPTINQIIKRNYRNKKNIRKRTPEFKEGSRSAPQKKGVITKLLILKPKKPNSAKRKVAKVLLANKKHIYAYIPGIGHNLQIHSIVLIRGGRTQDLPGVRYKIIRGKYDCLGVIGRTTSRSKYGTKVTK